MCVLSHVGCVVASESPALFLNVVSDIEVSYASIDPWNMQHVVISAQ